jgi:gluconokinase
VTDSRASSQPGGTERIRSTPVLIVTGVSGSGKTTIGRLLAARTGWTFHDADDYHTSSNVERMRAGTALTDEDRLPWLDELRRRVVAPSLESGTPAILACSALKASYIERLTGNDPRVKVIHLRGDRELIRKRLEHREGHFMKPAMLASQFADLEEPERALVVDIDRPPPEIVDRIMGSLGLQRAP